MSRQEKLLAKLLSKQSGFTWQELTILLNSLGYRKLEGQGSRVRGLIMEIRTR